MGTSKTLDDSHSISAISMHGATHKQDLESKKAAINRAAISQHHDSSVVLQSQIGADASACDKDNVKPNNSARHVIKQAQR